MYYTKCITQNVLHKMYNLFMFENCTIYNFNLSLTAALF